MNTRQRELLILVTGLALGAVTAHLITKKKYEAEIQEIFDELDGSTTLNEQAKFQFLRGTRSSVALVEDGFYDSESLSNIVETYHPRDIAAENERLKNQVMSNYQTRSEQYDTRSKEAPYPIKAEEFFEEEDFDKCNLTYYEADGVLADENEEPLDIDTTIGREIIEIMASDRDDNTFYVRNEKTGTDFEICREEGSYSELVMGDGEDYAD